MSNLVGNGEDAVTLPDRAQLVRDKPTRRVRAFHSIGQILRLVLIVLLLAILAATVGQVVRRLATEDEVISGVMTGVNERRASNRQAEYHLLLRPEEGAALELRLRNNGRILPALLAGEIENGSRVSATLRNDVIVELAPLPSAAGSIREGQPTLAVTVAMAIVTLLLVLALGMPGRLEGRR